MSFKLKLSSAFNRANNWMMEPIEISSSVKVGFYSLSTAFLAAATVATIPVPAMALLFGAGAVSSAGLGAAEASKWKAERNEKKNKPTLF